MTPTQRRQASYCNHCTLTSTKSPRRWNPPKADATCAGSRRFDCPAPGGQPASRTVRSALTDRRATPTFPGRATPASRRTAYRIFTLSAPSGFRTPGPLVFIQAWTLVVVSALAAISRATSSTPNRCATGWCRLSCIYKASDQPKQNVPSPRFSHGIVENRRALGETRAPLTPLPGAWTTVRQLGERDMATPTACQCHRRHGIASAHAICPSKPSDVAMSR